MAGRGFAPTGRAMNPNRNGEATKTIEFVGCEQPPLPEGDDYPEWHPHTRVWWAMWRDSPQAVHFMASDWDYMLETASLHTSFWRKANFNVAAELRLRVAKFGATPEDRARLRMTFADADEKDARRAPAAGASARERRGAALHGLPTAK